MRRKQTILTSRLMVVWFVAFYDYGIFKTSTIISPELAIALIFSKLHGVSGAYHHTIDEIL